MTRRRGAIWSERLLLGLILASLTATLNLVLMIHRRSEARRPASPPDLTSESAAQTLPSNPAPNVIAESPDPPVPAKAPIGISDQKRPEPALRRKPPEDPTKTALAALGTATAKEIEAGAEADRRAASLRAASDRAVAESQRWKRREMLVRQQIAGLTERAERLDRDVQSMDAERDVLARERDALKAALTKAGQRSGYAVLPYKGPTGTWQRPIILECTAAGAKLQPDGPSFTALELSPLIHRRSSPLVQAIARELIHIRSSDTPDGAPAVPYLVFLVRPDGIRAYYEARTCLESLGIAFGYELIDQDRVVNFPDFDDLTTWDGTIPLEMPLEAAPRPKSSLALRSPANGGGGNGASAPPGLSQGSRAARDERPEQSNRQGRLSGSLTAGTDETSPDDFVWPGSRRRAADDSSRGSVASHDRFGDSVATDSRSPGHGDPLPDLEPAGDVSANVPLQPRSGRSSQQPVPPALAAAARSRDPGPGQARPGTAPPGAIDPWTIARSAGGPTRPLDAVQIGRAPSSLEQRGSTSDGNGDWSQIAAPGLAGIGSDALHDAAGAGQRGGRPLQTRGSRHESTDVPPPTASADVAAGSRLAAGEGSPALAGTKPASGTSSSDIKNAANTSGNADLGVRQTESRRDAAGSSAISATPSSTDPITSIAGTGATVATPPSSSTRSVASSTSATQAPPPSFSRDSAGAGSDASFGVAPSFDTSAAATGKSASWSMPSGLSASAAPAETSPSGMPLGFASASTTPSSGSGFSLGSDAPSRSNSSDDMIVPPRPRPVPAVGSIEVPFEIVVVCRQYDILLHPGGYRLTVQAMQEQGDGHDGLLVREIRAMVRRRAVADPMIRPRPAIRFLVESYGSESFWMARRQLLFTLPDWPMTLQVSSSQEPRVFCTGPW
jgi:hypothetical protein